MNVAPFITTLLQSHQGELEFRRGGVEAFRLIGIQEFKKLFYSLDLIERRKREFYEFPRIFYIRKSAAVYPIKTGLAN